jgi:hypothetical protein
MTLISSMAGALTLLCRAKRPMVRIIVGQSGMLLTLHTQMDVIRNPTVRMHAHAKPRDDFCGQILSGCHTFATFLAHNKNMEVT